MELDLFGLEPQPLAITHPILAKGMTKEDRKAQDIIFDLYKTQRNFCQTLVIVKVVI